MEIFCKLLGMCITFIPTIYFAVYMIKRATEEQRFDLHLKRVRDKAGTIGVLVAIVNRFLLFLLLTSVGLYITSYFSNSITLDIAVISLITYIISYFIDNKNDI